MAQSIKPLNLPKLSAGFAELTNALTAAALPDAFPLGTTAAAPALATEPLRFTPALVVTFTVNGRVWEMAFSDTAFLKAHPLFSDPALQGTDPEGLPGDLKEALAQTLITPLLLAASQKLGLPVQCTDIAFHSTLKSDRVAGFALTLQSDPDKPLWVAFATESAESRDAVCSAVKAKMPGAPDAARAAGLPVTLRVLAGDLPLTLEEINSIKNGDVLLPQNAGLPLTKLTLAVQSGGRTWLCAPCSLNGQTATLEDSFAPVAEKPMQDTKTIEVTLTFELEERTVTLAELSNLKKGSVFTLTSDPQSPVRILANGKPLAQGRLVDVNGQLGVQVTSES